MSEIAVANKRKNKQRSKKVPGKVKSQNRQKRKIHLSQKFEENEKEVTALLENSSLLSDYTNNCGRDDNKSPSEKFFCGTVEATTRRDSKILINNNTLDGERSDGSAEHEEVLSKQSADVVSTTGQSQRQPTMASSFILIVEDVVDDMVKVVCTPRLFNQEEFIFKPSLGLENNLLSYPTHVKLHWNINLMFNRLHVEAKSRKEKVDLKILKSLQESKNVQKTFYWDALLYKTVCDLKFKPIFVQPSWDSMEIPSKKLLTMFIRDLRFTEHPDLQDEHRLANELELLYEHRAQRLKEKICEKLYADLQVERNILNDLLKSEETAARINHPESQQNRALRIENHMHKIKALREKHYDEERTNKQLLQDILESWMKLKAQRKQQSHQYTRLMLRLKIEDLSITEQKSRQQHFDKRFETDLNEIFREKLEEYYRAKRLWRGQRLAGEEELTPRPRKPNITNLSSELRDTFTKCFLNPSDPHVDVIRICANDPGYVDQPGPRKLRSYCMRVFFDQQIVAETRCYRLERDLSITVNEKLGVVLNRRLPKDIRVKLYKKSKVSSSQKIANIIVPLPLQSLSSQETQSLTLTFSSHKQPMSGFLRLDLESDQQIYSPETINTLFPPPKHHTKIPRNIIKDWHQRNLLECPQGAATEHPVTALSCSDTEDEAAKTEQATTCTFHEDNLRFCDVAELDNNPRFKLLRSRYLKSDSRTKDMKFIPMLEHELEFDWELEEPVIDLGDWMEPVDVRKHEGKKYLRQLYETIRIQCNRMTKAVESRENLLLNDEPLSWSAFFQTVKFIFQPRLIAPPTQGLPSSRPGVSMLTMDSTQNFKLICNITRATGIPVRIANAADTESRDRNSPESSNVFLLQNFKYSNVRPFVAVSYKDKFCRTMTAEGSNPTWNEQLILQLSGSLTDLRDDVKISLYDEVIENQWNEDDALKNVDLFQRIQNNWLGEYRIPINAILTQQTLDAVFEINIPKVLIGYRRPSLDSIASNAESNMIIEQFPEINESVRLWCFISIEPTFELPSINTKSLECSELTEVRHFVNEWSLVAMELYGKKVLHPLICSNDGKSLCITRLLQPLATPVVASENLLESACRFVSLLATPKSFDPCLYFKGIWLSNEVLLDTTWGSYKDLGVLLCNYLLHLGLQCWLVLGVAYPYGECTYVLFYSDDAEMFYLDPCTGKRYGVKDVFCPLQEIKVVVSTDNFYVNIQPESRVSMLNLNFGDSSCWLACFNRRNPAPLGGFQLPGYKYKTPFSVVELKFNIERKIMKKISAWRTMRKTIWNRALHPRLLTILQSLEQSTTFSNSSSYAELKYNNMLAAEFPNFQIFGFTLNYSYTNLNQISERIKSTGIHLNSHKNVEYTVAVHIHPYPNNVLSIWIFLISIVPL